MDPIQGFTQEAAGVGSWLLRSFWSKEGASLPDPDLTRSAGMTGTTFVLGWLSSINMSKRKLKARVVDELILCQTELHARAYPAKWSKDGHREAWMLAPFVARLRFLHTGLFEQKSLRPKQLEAIDTYVTAVEEFVDIWAAAERRGGEYKDGYKSTRDGLRLAVKRLGYKQLKSLDALAAPKDKLFGGGPGAGAGADPKPAGVAAE